MSLKIKVNCKYCGLEQAFKFVPNETYKTFDEAFADNVEVICAGCNEPIRINECISSELKGYSNFNLGKDHTYLKQRIKEWETKLDSIYLDLQSDSQSINGDNMDDICQELECITNEMMSINM